ncbi:MAG: methyltransferase domain-containing protein, partial [Gammaproteobacteria bacterium]|nr:methyltransferase domain-containing protein [Gammaproteobacteria bacterium]
EQTGWEQKAADYHALIGGITRSAAASMLAGDTITPTTRLLDVACGPGYIAGMAHSYGANVTGLDFAPAMVKLAQQQYPDCEFMCGDAEELPFTAESFDIVTCAFGLLHLAEPERALREALRILKPGGRYLFTVWDTPEKHDFFRIVLDAIQTHGTLDLPLPPAPPFFRFSDPVECRSALGDAGFVDMEVKEILLYQHAQDATELLTMLEKSSVRAAMLLEAQSAGAQIKIKQAILHEAAHFKQATGYQLAWPVIMISAVKPDKY